MAYSIVYGNGVYGSGPYNGSILAASWLETDPLVRLATWLNQGAALWLNNLDDWRADPTKTIWTETV